LVLFFDGVLEGADLVLEGHCDVLHLIFHRLLVLAGLMALDFGLDAHLVLHELGLLLGLELLLAL
jgi:hypothetical protein